MVRYMTMKRITQILASTLFVITVLTIYLAFDFALNTAASQRTHSHKRTIHQHDDDHLTKSTKKRSVTLLIPHLGDKSNQLLKHPNINEDFNVNRKRQISNRKNPLHPKPGSFHKGKTGVKVNKPLKSVKEQQKRLPTSTMTLQRKDKLRA